jgi:hypothetical protein
MAVTKVTPAGLTTSQIGRNLLINGAMTVYQHGEQTAAASNQYSLDRWCWHQSSGETGTKSQNTSVPSGSGFAFSYKYDVTNAGGAPGAAEFNIIEQRIEAQNLQHLCYGNAAAKTLVLSFWMSSPKSGTHCVALNAPDGGRSYIREFTVASADTWEKFAITFPGDTGGTITNDNGTGLRVVFPLNVGSNYETTKDQWASGEDFATSSGQNLLDNTSNNVFLTGCQLEVGDGVTNAPTDFEHEDYATTLLKCQRYCYRITRASADLGDIGSGYWQSTTAFYAILSFPTSMRTVSTMSISATSDVFVRLTSGSATSTNVELIGASEEFAFPLVTVSSGGTAGNGGLWGILATDEFLQFKAEL